MNLSRMSGCQLKWELRSSNVGFPKIEIKSQVTSLNWPKVLLLEVRI